MTMLTGAGLRLSAIAARLPLIMPIAVCAFLGSPASAQRRPGYTPFSNGVGPASPCAFADTDGTIVACSAANPLPVSGGGSSGGGGGAVTPPDGAIIGIGALSSPAAGSTNYRLGQLLTALGTPYQAGGALPLPPGAATDTVAKAAAASFTYAPASGSAESSAAASYSFSSTNVALARAWYADCPTGTTVKVTMTDPNGGAAPVTLYDGHYGPVAERIASFAGNSGACTIGLEF